MKTLLIHAKHFEYEAREKALDAAESIDGNRSGSFENALVVFVTVEKGDGSSQDVVEEAAADVLDVFRRVGASRVVVYPYAHLSDDLADPEEAKRVLSQLAERISSAGVPVSRAPFGWYKRFSVECYGHPLSELSRTIKPGRRVRPGYADFAVMFPDGRIVGIEELRAEELPEDFVALLEAEVFKKKREGGEPKYLEYCRKFGFEWEPMSDLGHMRYGPEATIMLDAVAEYAWQCARSLGIPVYKVRGTNTFNLSFKPVAQHAQLFGDRLYQMEVDEKKLILRYAACHQQFAMVKDWEISYRDLPFGAFEVADSYRLEQPGELLLCFRLRKFYMPDLHVFCKDLAEAMEVSFRIHSKIYEEIRKLGRDYVSIYNLTRSFLEQHRDYLKRLVEMEGKPVLLHFVPEGKYYWVINVEYNIIDELGRPREIGTFQIDVGNAERFGITYVDENNTRRYPVIIHTAIIGSLERYVFAVLDTAAKKARAGEVPSLPLWLSPVQVRVIPHSSEYLKLADSIADKLEEQGIRVDVDDREESLAKRIRDAEVKWIPYVVVVGKREAESGKLTVRVRGQGQYEMSLEELVGRLVSELKGYPRVSAALPRYVSARPRYSP
ncbi:threonine--tRNA ligase [Thermofilum pendens]|uniref:Threonine--tRNA ligase n=1 Tax=Thermofilum pendens (strain DSM 2475 / Hrk 5) TaxID=368408 RepID=SYT_THEPD|nr:threonine--tRNA ligase [Thermofilum pendens]A1RY76.1 RecName: Full=Threonine--tRNA ligase; AltName: Full=Threonyl-tRNA synthetase; Short=ThrRS [Thermofilum pendens Hrk 5]ABL78156.1 Ser-tRNA(Thr) hydrolase / threonyl-tRNA synthetase [Thermofilum pendens Hrk 5]